MKEIRFSPYAIQKLSITQHQGFVIDEAAIIETIRRPREVLPGYLNRFIVQVDLDAEHILRVVYEEDGDITVVTLYPGRRRRYES